VIKLFFLFAPFFLNYETTFSLGTFPAVALAYFLFAPFFLPIGFPSLSPNFLRGSLHSTLPRHRLSNPSFARTPTASFFAPYEVSVLEKVRPPE